MCLSNVGAAAKDAPSTHSLAVSSAGRGKDAAKTRLCRDACEVKFKGRDCFSSPFRIVRNEDFNWTLRSENRGISFSALQCDEGLWSSQPIVCLAAISHRAQTLLDERDDTNSCVLAAERIFVNDSGVCVAFLPTLT